MRAAKADAVERRYEKYKAREERLKVSEEGREERHAARAAARRRKAEERQHATASALEQRYLDVSDEALAYEAERLAKMRASAEKAFFSPGYVCLPLLAGAAAFYGAATAFHAARAALHLVSGAVDCAAMVVASVPFGLIGGVCACFAWVCFWEALDSCASAPQRELDRRLDARERVDNEQTVDVASVFDELGKD